MQIDMAFQPDGAGDIIALADDQVSAASGRNRVNCPGESFGVIGFAVPVDAVIGCLK